FQSFVCGLGSPPSLHGPPTTPHPQHSDASPREARTGLGIASSLVPFPPHTARSWSDLASAWSDPPHPLTKPSRGGDPMSAAVEEQMVVKAIREECPWESLPKRLQSTLHTKDEWHRRIVDYCIRKRLQWNTCFARRVYREGEYYEEMMRYLRRNLALYPYHLADYMCRVLRISPFRYYCDILFETMKNGNLLLTARFFQRILSCAAVLQISFNYFLLENFHIYKVIMGSFEICWYPRLIQLFFIC
uniref:FAM91 N-terminal domain-containing protein n=1 Tax=Aegilops tauschii subsp. strangulata TaxID=200361 RepID=A0A453EUW9_AEGTS